MKKKLTTLLMVAVAAFALAACGKEATTETPTPVATDTPAPSNTPTDTPSPTPTEVPHVHADADDDGICDGCKETVKVTMTGATDVVSDATTGATQHTVVNLSLNIVDMTASLDMIMPVAGVGDMYLLASEAGTDPATSWLYMMATIIGKGTVTEKDGGYKVSFAWTTSSLNEETGETTVTPMEINVDVAVANGVYTATVNYIDYIIADVTSAAN